MMLSATSRNCTSPTPESSKRKHSCILMPRICQRSQLVHISRPQEKQIVNETRMIGICSPLAVTHQSFGLSSELQLGQSQIDRPRSRMKRLQMAPAGGWVGPATVSIPGFTGLRLLRWMGHSHSSDRRNQLLRLSVDHLLTVSFIWPCAQSSCDVLIAIFLLQDLRDPARKQGSRSEHSASLSSAEC